jgi:hypothetical protein
MTNDFDDNLLDVVADMPTNILVTPNTLRQQNLKPSDKLVC